MASNRLKTLTKSPGLKINGTGSSRTQTKTVFSGCPENPPLQRWAPHGPHDDVSNWRSSPAAVRMANVPGCPTAPTAAFLLHAGAAPLPPPRHPRPSSPAGVPPPLHALLHRHLPPPPECLRVDGASSSPWLPRRRLVPSPAGSAASSPPPAGSASYLLGAAPSYSYPEEATEEEEEAMVARQGKEVARRRSLFSLGMSLAVGAVAWSADAPCLPLLAGLFAVVGVSMRSVSRSCAALRRSGPAAADDAVALLSLNWFLLGVLTAPMLPGVARAVVPRAGRVLGPAIAWLAAVAPL